MKPERTTDHGQATGKLYHLQLWVAMHPFCNLQSRARTHAILVIGLYELLGNPNYLTHWATRALSVHRRKTDTAMKDKKNCPRKLKKEEIIWMHYLCPSQNRVWISNVICRAHLFVFIELRWNVIDCFVGMGGFVDHHCLNIPFIILKKAYLKINSH